MRPMALPADPRTDDVRNPDHQRHDDRLGHHGNGSFEGFGFDDAAGAEPVTQIADVVSGLGVAKTDVGEGLFCAVVSSLGEKRLQLKARDADVIFHVLRSFWVGRLIGQRADTCLENFAEAGDVFLPFGRKRDARFDTPKGSHVRLSQLVVGTVFNQAD